eukprot:TRINITY_DN5899_c1_g1_i1.p1 TRINITY_DN5899_c1_g1~~TRINITY_DN5899_c1_g1_i1.p1  ORF type:complete len:320 (+),score=76.83 TRINITY_DN5899_c1_g1_i1:68-961(+)
MAEIDAVGQLARAISAASPKADIPAPLVALSSREGLRRLTGDVAAAQSFGRLARFFYGQKTRSTCGPASVAAVVSSLRGEPVSEEDVLRPECAEAPLKMADVRRRGSTLPELADVGAMWCQTTTVRPQLDGEDSFRKQAAEALRQGRGVVVNFSRSGVVGGNWGHVSPLGAYCAETDSFLLMDIARHRFEPYWVPTGQLVRSMCTMDSRAQMPRGALILEPYERVAEMHVPGDRVALTRSGRERVQRRPRTPGSHLCAHEVGVVERSEAARDGIVVSVRTSSGCVSPYWQHELRAAA